MNIGVGVVPRSALVLIALALAGVEPDCGQDLRAVTKKAARESPVRPAPLHFVAAREEGATRANTSNGSTSGP